jgi:cell division protein FtsL
VPGYDGTAALKRRSDLAYDLARFDRRTAVRRAYEAEAEQTVARPAVRRKVAVKQGLFTRVSLFAVLSFFMVIGLLLLVVYSYVQLRELSVNGTQLQKQYDALKNEEALMLSESEQRISLKDAEDYAVNKLGMVKPEQDQVIYLDLSGSDHAEVLEDSQKDGSEFAKGISHMLASIVSFIN